jgi:hypothetical protein
MRRLLASMVAGMSLSLVTAQLSEAAVTPGTKCSKVGATSTSKGMKYTCVKKGSKLIWSKGVSTVKPVPVTSSKPTPKPTPTAAPTISQIPERSGRKLCESMQSTSVFQETPRTSSSKNSGNVSLWAKYSLSRPNNFEQIASSVQTAFTKSYLGVATQAPQIDFYIDPELKAEANLLAQINSIIKVVQIEYLFLERQFDKPISVVFFTDWDWLEKLHIEGGCSVADASVRANKRLDTAAGWATSDNSALYLNFSGSKRNDLVTGNPGWLAAHELFHLIQFNHFAQFAGRPPFSIPGWFTEGGATLMSPLVLGMDTRWLIQADNQSAQQIDSKSSLEDLSSNSGRNYSLGPIANEFLIYLVGFNKYLAIWKEMGKGKVFANAFPDATGIELKDFYAMFEEIRPTIGIPIL